MSGEDKWNITLRILYPYVNRDIHLETDTFPSIEDVHLALKPHGALATRDLKSDFDGAPWEFVVVWKGRVCRSYDWSSFEKFFADKVSSDDFASEKRLILLLGPEYIMNVYRPYPVGPGLATKAPDEPADSPTRTGKHQQHASGAGSQSEGPLNRSPTAGLSVTPSTSIHYTERSITPTEDLYVTDKDETRASCDEAQPLLTQSVGAYKAAQAFNHPSKLKEVKPVYLIRVDLPGEDGRGYTVFSKREPCETDELKRRVFEHLSKTTNKWQADNEDDEADFMENFIPKVGILKYEQWRTRQVNGKAPEPKRPLTKVKVHLEPVNPVANSVAGSLAPAEQTSAYGSFVTGEGQTPVGEVDAQDEDLLGAPTDPPDTRPLFDWMREETQSNDQKRTGPAASKDGNKAYQEEPPSRTSAEDLVAPTVKPDSKTAKADRPVPSVSSSDDKTKFANAPPATKSESRFVVPETAWGASLASPEENRWGYYKRSHAAKSNAFNMPPEPALSRIGFPSDPKYSFDCRPGPPHFSMSNQFYDLSNKRYLFRITDDQDRVIVPAGWPATNLPSTLEMRTVIGMWEGSKGSQALHDHQIYVRSRSNCSGPDLSYDDFFASRRRSFASSESYKNEPCEVIHVYLARQEVDHQHPSQAAETGGIGIQKAYVDSDPATLEQPPQLDPKAHLQEQDQVTGKTPTVSSAHPINISSISPRASTGRYGIQPSDETDSSPSNTPVIVSPQPKSSMPKATKLASSAGDESGNSDQSSTESVEATEPASPAESLNDLQRVTSRTYLDEMIAAPSNTLASAKLFTIMRDEEISPASSLGLKLLDLAYSLRTNGGLSPASQEPAAVTEKAAGKIESRLNEFADMLNHIAESVGVNLEGNERSGKQTNVAEGEVKVNKGQEEEDHAAPLSPSMTSLFSQLATSSRQVAESVNSIPSPYRDAKPLPPSLRLEDIVKQAHMLEKDEDECSDVSEATRASPVPVTTAPKIRNQLGDYERRLRDDANTRHLLSAISTPSIDAITGLGLPADRNDRPPHIPWGTRPAVFPNGFDNSPTDSTSGVPRLDAFRHFPNPFAVPPHLGHSYRYPRSTSPPLFGRRGGSGNTPPYGPDHTSLQNRMWRDGDEMPYHVGGWGSYARPSSLTTMPDTRAHHHRPAYPAGFGFMNPGRPYGQSASTSNTTSEHHQQQMQQGLPHPASWSVMGYPSSSLWH